MCVRSSIHRNILAMPADTELECTKLINLSPWQVNARGRGWFESGHIDFVHVSLKHRLGDYVDFAVTMNTAGLHKSMANHYEEAILRSVTTR